ncbi:hypothetical protein BD779DRAFT_1805392, partial [Infundibulicybe gibba]
ATGQGQCASPGQCAYPCRCAYPCQCASQDQCACRYASPGLYVGDSGGALDTEHGD